MTRADSIEAQARAYLRLFPEWMRDVRGEEVLGLVLDQVPSGATSLPWRSKLDLARAGLHARRRGTPPWSVRQQVAQAPRSVRNGRGAAVPLAWRPWLITALRRRGFAWRCAFRLDLSDLMLVVVLAGLYLPEWGERLLWWLPGTVAVIVAVRGTCFLVFSRRRWRARLTAANGLDGDGSPLPPDALTVMWVEPTMPNRLVVAGALGALGGALVAGPVAWTVFAPAPDHRPPVPAHPLSWSLALVLLIVVGAWCTAGLLVRRAGSPDQAIEDPNVAAGPHGERWQTVATGMLLGAVAGFALGAAGRLAWLQPVVLAAGPLGVAVAVAVFRRRERRRGRPLGVWDLFPDKAPQRVVRKLDDLPAPPPDLPAPS